jgi:hypothetical protein
MPGCVKCEQPSVREESVGSTHLIGETTSKAGTLFLLASSGLITARWRVPATLK